MNLTKIQKIKIEVHKLHLSVKEIEVLDLIISNPKIKQKEISIKINSKESYVSKIVKRLAKFQIFDKSKFSDEFIFK